MKLYTLKRDPIDIAEENGYNAGRQNIQTCKQNYWQSDLLLAWFSGWRRGQAEYWQPIADRLGEPVDVVRRYHPGVLSIKLAATQSTLFGMKGIRKRSGESVRSRVAISFRLYAKACS